MYCHKCGAENPARARSCIVCGAPVAAAEQDPPAANSPGVPPPQAFAIAHPAGSRPYGGAATTQENTSGWGAAYPLPREARGWTFAGLVPFGLFPLYNGMQAWGVAGLVLTALGFPLFFLVLPFQLAYIIYLGLKGRELAWRSRRFRTVSEFEQAMHVWNVVGMISLIVGAILLVAWCCFIFSTPFFLPGGGAGTGCYT